MTREEMMSRRKLILDKLENLLLGGHKPEERSFFYHPNEDRIVLSHALFWVLSKPFAKVLQDYNALLFLRQCEDEMLSAYLTKSDEYPELLHNCNICFDCLLVMLASDIHDRKNEEVAKKLFVTAAVASGYGGDMADELANELLDDMEFSYNKVCCCKIEGILPQLNKMIENELHEMNEEFR